MNEKEFYIFVLILLVRNFFLEYRCQPQFSHCPRTFLLVQVSRWTLKLFTLNVISISKFFFFFFPLNFMLFVPWLIEHPLRLRNLVCLNCDWQYEGKLSYHTICSTNKLTKRLILYLNETPRKGWQIPSIAFFVNDASCMSKRNLEKSVWIWFLKFHIITPRGNSKSSSS